jgi:hypothetical protein
MLVGLILAGKSKNRDPKETVVGRNYCFADGHLCVYGMKSVSADWKKQTDRFCKS